MKPNKNVLVTGGCGYFGELLVKQLIAKKYNCFVYDISNPTYKVDGVKYILGDIRNAHEVLSACKDMDIVFHNVAQVPLAKDRNEFESVNVTGTKILLEAALQTKVSKVVYTSSSAVFGVPKENPVTENAIPEPGESYGKAKYDGEILCNEYVDRGLDVTIIRPRTIIGHGRLGIFQILFDWIREGKNIPVLGDGSNIYQFVHADDLAVACIKAGDLPGPDVFNCGAMEFGTMREVLEDVCTHAKTGSRVVGVPKKLFVNLMKFSSYLSISPLAPYHALMYGESMYFDTSKAISKLDWYPVYSNKQMFIQSYEWYLNNYKKVHEQTNASHHKSALKQGVLKMLGWLI